MDLLELEEGIIQSCNMLSVESFLKETKENPLDWYPISNCHEIITDQTLPSMKNIFKLAQNRSISNVVYQMNSINVSECVDSQEVENLVNGILCYIHIIKRTQLYENYYHV